MLGDGTGAGKGRQCAGIILDNWCQERRKAIWVSKSSALIE
ncbi:strawberry notch family protein, partial [Nostoc muscorum FACHB-395]|nr:strawberry notch family protein [Desmonostoc muscorum FACHB-395]